MRDVGLGLLVMLLWAFVQGLNAGAPSAYVGSLWGVLQLSTCNTVTGSRHSGRCQWESCQQACLVFLCTSTLAHYWAGVETSHKCVPLAYMSLHLNCFSVLAHGVIQCACTNTCR